MSSRERAFSNSITWIIARACSGVGLGLDRAATRRATAGDRQVRLDLHALDALLDACGGVAPNAAYAARDLDVAAEGQDVLAAQRVRTDDEGAMPELAVEVLGW